MAYLGLLTRKEAWSLTGYGWLVLFIGSTVSTLFLISTIHPFLALNQPVRGEVLVVEGWLTDDALKKAVIEFNSHDYQLLITTGGPLQRGYHLSEYKTYADLSASTIRNLGVDEKRVIAVPAPAVKTDRTLASVLSLNQWLLSSDLSIESLDIYSLDVHARRSWLLFNKILGDRIKVGVIASDETGYDPQEWWKYSAGVQAVLREVIGYIYVKLFFFYRPAPSESGSQDATTTQSKHNTVRLGWA